MKKRYVTPQIKPRGQLKTVTKGKPTPGKCGQPNDWDGHTS